MSRCLTNTAAALALLALGACASPEATRVRGGGPGADIGNRAGVIEMHEGSVIYANTPCVTTLPECNGPMPLGTARRR
jgi:hypothetical protein